MKHSVDPHKLGDLGLPIVDAIQSCVHCGFCLPTCPTYDVLAQEMDSPRGRIVLMKEVLEGQLDVNDAAHFVDRCLGCLACETSCPSGVQYGQLHSAFQTVVRESRSQNLSAKAHETLVHKTIPFAGRFRLAVGLQKYLRPFRFLMPRTLRPMFDLIPGQLAAKQHVPIESPATGQRKGRVGLLAGCAQQVLAPEINLSAVRVLNAVGFDVFTPQSQTCCGALDWHEGRRKAAQTLARGNLQIFPDDLDVIITTTAGCGSAINEYKLLFGNSEFSEAAKRFSDRVVDISSFLDKQELPPMRMKSHTRVTYHDACHLAHAQGVRSAPRRLLRQIENVELVPLANADRCCGSAGTYNLKQPEIAQQLGRQKAQAIMHTGCAMVATGNIGCLIQILDQLRGTTNIEAVHTIQILDQALRSK